MLIPVWLGSEKSDSINRLIQIIQLTVIQLAAGTVIEISIFQKYFLSPHNSACRHMWRIAIRLDNADVVLLIYQLQGWPDFLSFGPNLSDKLCCGP